VVEQVYTELRRIAARYVRREHAPTIQATELVHEAYLRMARGKPAEFQNRSHFLALAAIAMRRLLVERARARRAVKRGGPKMQVTLDDRLLAESDSVSSIDLIALDRALTELASIDREQARIVELRYFGGLSVEETADVLAVSPATVKRHWTVARAWLHRALAGVDSGDSSS
jgi:RNA polymerase sigma factor (TIGR02999 family)